MVRIATSGMYYPGTMERAVLVAGEIDGVKVGAQFFFLQILLHMLYMYNVYDEGITCVAVIEERKSNTA